MRFPIEDGPPSARSFGPADDGGGRDGRERKRTKDKKPIWVDSIGKPNRDAPNQKLDHNVIIDEAKSGKLSQGQTTIRLLALDRRAFDMRTTARGAGSYDPSSSFD